MLIWFFFPKLFSIFFFIKYYFAPIPGIVVSIYAIVPSFIVGIAVGMIFELFQSSFLIDHFFPFLIINIFWWLFFFFQVLVSLEMKMLLCGFFVRASKPSNIPGYWIWHKVIFFFLCSSFFSFLFLIELLFWFQYCFEGFMANEFKHGKDFSCCYETLTLQTSPLLIIVPKSSAYSLVFALSLI